MRTETTAERASSKGVRSFGRLVAILAAAAGIAVLGAVPKASAGSRTFAIGDVFISVGDGQVQWRDAAGNLVETLNNTTGAITTGMAFDKNGSLYVTNFSTNNISRFDRSGTLLGLFASGFDAHPESILFDKDGNAYVGQADGTGDVIKLNPSGVVLDSFDLPRERRGSDWIDLAADQRTLFYTSEGTTVLRYDLTTESPLPNFATGLHGPAFALRILKGGGVLVADSVDIHRLDANGTVVRTYDVPGVDNWFALNLDPDQRSMWSAAFGSGTVAKFDIETGNLLLTYQTGSSNTFGLSVFGEITAVVPTAPTNLTATLVNNSRVDLLWLDNSNNEQAFEVERATDDGPFGLLATTPANTTTLQDTNNLQPDREYRYRVRATNGAGASPYSNEDSVETFGPPPAPTNLVAVICEDGIQLRWTDNSPNEEKFELEARFGPTQFSLVSTVGPNVTRTEFSNLTERTVYYFRVRAVNVHGASAYSNLATAVAPPAIAGRISVVKNFNFGRSPVTVGTSRSKNVSVKNTHPSQSLRVVVVGVTGPFVLEDTGINLLIPPQGTFPVPVSFAPTAAGNATGQLLLQTSDPNNRNVSVGLTGRGRK